MRILFIGRIMKFLGFYKLFQCFTLLLFVSLLAISVNAKECDSEGISRFKSSDKFCSSIVCDKLEKCENGDLVENESYGRCCAVCVKHLSENEECTEVHDESLRDIGASRCKKGLKCVNGKCVLPEPDKTDPPDISCLHLEKILKDSRGKGLFSERLWAPACDSAGNYKPTQTKIRIVICVDENGKKIFGTGDSTVNNSCACSRYMENKRKEVKRCEDFIHIKQQEHCSETGSFKELQCINDLCYCADTETGEIIGRMVQSEYLDKLPCYKPENGKEYMTNCEKKTQWSRKLSYEFCLKGIALYVKDNDVECDLDGSFAPKQCNEATCYCTDKTGVGTIYKEDRQKLDNGNIKMLCNCAREETTPEGSIKCLGYGNYRALQCVSSSYRFQNPLDMQKTCYCFDDDGDIISKSSAELTDTSCKELRNTLERLKTGNPNDDQIITPSNTEGTDYYDDNDDYDNDDYFQ